MSDRPADIENKAQICRITCGWKKLGLPLDAVLRYWRDVHSPAIARRPGIWEYRHFQYNAVRPIFPELGGVDQSCATNKQLMWLSDVRYADEIGLQAFSAEPNPDVRGELLGDIDLIVDQSTTYKALGSMAHTWIERSAMVPPQGPPQAPTFSLFFRACSPETQFHAFMRQLAHCWAAEPAVLRLRLSLLEAPDVAAERAAGYPIKTHAPEDQYQAWIDVTLVEEESASELPLDGVADHVSALHAYPVAANYTSNYAGKPTFVGLRGYPAWDALTAIGGYNQAQPAILQWMYGDVAQGVALEPVRR